MYGLTSQKEGYLNLQSTLSASSASGAFIVTPHHPISCPTHLRLEEDGAFSCDHAMVPPGDVRTQTCVDHSIAILLMEILGERP